MEYNRIISVTGLGGLFELVGSKTDGAIVRSLEDKTTKFVSSRSHHFSHLESIEVYTVRENVNLIDVFKAMKAASEAIPDYKDIQAVKAYFSQVSPDMDFERVYTSDMKKMVRWYNILVSNEVDFDAVQQGPLEAETAEAAPAPEEAAIEAEAPKKAAKKKIATTQDEEIPKKKAAPKKKKKEEE